MGLTVSKIIDDYSSNKKNDEHFNSDDEDIVSIQFSEKCLEEQQSEDFEDNDDNEETINKAKEQAIKYCLRHNSPSAPLYLITLNGINIGYRLTLRSAHRAIKRMQRIILENKPLNFQYVWNTSAPFYRSKSRYQSIPFIKKFNRATPKFQHYTLTSINNNYPISYPRVEDVITLERISYVMSN